MRRGRAGVAKALGLAGRGFVAIVGLVLTAIAFAPTPEPEYDPPTETVHLEAGGGRFALRAPDGRSTRSLTVVDGSDRPLLTLTRWPDGSLAVVSRWAGPHVAFWLNEPSRAASFGATGEAGQAALRFRPDGDRIVDRGEWVGHGRDAGVPEGIPADGVGPPPPARDASAASDP